MQNKSLILYEAVEVIDKLDGETRIGCVISKCQFGNDRFVLVKVLGSANPKLESGMIVAEDGWKRSVYPETSIKYLGKCFINDNGAEVLDKTKEVWDERDEIFVFLEEHNLLKIRF